MWSKRSNLLQPLTVLMSNKVKFKSTVVEQKPFDEIKWIVARNNLLIYPNFIKHFDINTDDSEYQLGSAIRQYGKKNSFYSRKLTGPQTWYTITEN